MMIVKQIKTVAQVGLLALCLWPVARLAAGNWGAIGELAARLNAPAVLEAGLLLVLSSLYLPAAMATFTRGAVRRISYRHSALAYFASQPMKYLPGNFWILPGRVMLLRGLGHDTSQSSAGLLFEMTTQVLSSSLVAAVALGVGGFASAGHAGGAWLVIGGSLAVSALLLAAPELAQRALAGTTCKRTSSLSQAMAQMAEIPLTTRLTNLALTSLSFAFMWCLMGASLYLLLVATQPRLDWTLLKAAIGVSTLSWLIGFLAPFSPGGIGVREGAMVLLLNALVPGPQATLVALLSRALALVVEMAFAATAGTLLRSPRLRSLPPRAALQFSDGRTIERGVERGQGHHRRLQSPVAFGRWWDPAWSPLTQAGPNASEPLRQAETPETLASGA